MDASNPAQARNDILEIALVLWRARLFIAICTTLALAAGVATAMLIPATYRAEATLHLRESSGKNATLQSLASQLGPLTDLAGLSLAGGQGDERSVAIATLRSRSIIEAYIKANSLLPELFPSRWNAVDHKWKQSLLGRREPNIQGGYRLFMSKVFSVTEDKKTGLIVVSAEWRNRVRVKTWVEEIIASANATIKAKAIAESESNLRYLQEQSKNTSIVQLQNALYAMMEHEYGKLMMAHNDQDYVFRTIDPAVVPTRKARPRRTLIVIISALAGMTLGATILLLKHTLLLPPPERKP